MHSYAHGERFERKKKKPLLQAKPGKANYQ
jgi:hypothetical protein